MTRIRNERGDITTDLTEVKLILKEYLNNCMSVTQKTQMKQTCSYKNIPLQMTQAEINNLKNLKQVEFVLIRIINHP